MNDYLADITVEDARHMGDSAALEGVWPFDNPFQLGDPRHESWMRGYIDGPGILRGAS